jgi:hypothetical protein
MKKYGRIVILGLLVLSFPGISECFSPAEAFKGFFAVSTKELEELRKDALVKIFEEPYGDCYKRLRAIIEKMPQTSIYAEKKGMIAVYCSCLNDTPAGIFFTEIDPTHTKVEISSPSARAKDWVAANVFSGKVQPKLQRFSVKQSAML